MSTDLDACEPNPCQNLGHCIQLKYGRFRCECVGTGFYGKTCQNECPAAIGQNAFGINEQQEFPLDCMNIWPEGRRTPTKPTSKMNLDLMQDNFISTIFFATDYSIEICLHWKLETVYRKKHNHQKTRIFYFFITIINNDNSLIMYSIIFSYIWWHLFLNQFNKPCLSSSKGQCTVKAG